MSFPPLPSFHVTLVTVIWITSGVGVSVGCVRASGAWVPPQALVISAARIRVLISLFMPMHFLAYRGCQS